MDKIKAGVVIIIVISLAANVLLGTQLFLAGKKIQQAEEKARLNASVLSFADIFIAKVLRATGEISFEDRLVIENAVRDTRDGEILTKWQTFVAAQTEAEGREEVKNLLQLVVRKISY